ncbi:hypothetical protein ACFL6P_04450 [Candidatus Latescibacterota bacterium]
MNTKSRKLVVILACTAAVIVAVTAVVIIKSGGKVEITRTVVGEKFVIAVEAGDNWSSRTDGTLFMKNLSAPQMAFWLEDMKGKFQATLYVTKQTAVQDWPDRSYVKGHEDDKRQSALPIWAHKHIQAGVHPIETCSMCHDRVKSADKSIESEPRLDAFTAATPGGSFVREMNIPPGLAPGKYVVCAEINNAIDYNDRFQENLPEQFNRSNGISGQPSLFLSGFVTTGGDETIAVLKLAGHGHPAGKDGTVYSDMSGITTAADIVRYADVRYFP